MVLIVVVALCLLFSWVYLDDGDGGAEFRSEQVGDVMVWDYHIVYGDGQEADFVCTQTLVAVIGETHTYLNEYDDGRTSYSQDDGIADDLESVGTETVYLEGLGEFECDVYHVDYDNGDNDTWWYSGGTCVKAVYETDGSVQTSVLASTTVTGDAPEYGICGVDDTVEVGDFSAFVSYTMDVENGYALDAEGAFTFEVTSVEDGIVTYGHFDGEGFVDEHTTPVTDFATFDDDSYTLVGQALIDTYYGERQCDVYTIEGTGTTMLVGTGDGVIYAMVTSDGADTHLSVLTYSTEVYGDVPYDTSIIGADTPERVGDYYITVVRMTQADGTQWSGVYAYLKVSEIDGESVYGAVECDVVTGAFEDGTTYTCAYYGDFPIASTEVYPDGTIVEFTYVYNTIVAGPEDYGSCVQEMPEAGDIMIAFTTQPDGEPGIVLQTVLSVGDDTILFDQDGTEYEYPLEIFIYGFDRDGATYRGQALIDTLYGLRVCDVWSDEDGMYYLGADDGVNYLSEYADGSTAYFFSGDFILPA